MPWPSPKVAAVLHFARVFQTYLLSILSDELCSRAFQQADRETINLTRWADADRETDPIHFRRFRIFIDSVGIAITTGLEGPDECTPPNYFGISLLDDASALQDSHLLRLLPPAFAELHQRITTIEFFAMEAPFFLLAQLVLAFMGFAPSADIAQLSEQLEHFK